jgi:hypothetical protein
VAGSTDPVCAEFAFGERAGAEVADRGSRPVDFVGHFRVPLEAPDRGGFFERTSVSSPTVNSIVEIEQPAANVYVPVLPPSVVIFVFDSHNITSFSLLHRLR